MERTSLSLEMFVRLNRDPNIGLQRGLDASVSVSPSSCGNQVDSRAEGLKERFPGTDKKKNLPRIYLPRDMWKSFRLQTGACRIVQGSVRFCLSDSACLFCLFGRPLKILPIKEGRRCAVFPEIRERNKRSLSFPPTTFWPIRHTARPWNAARKASRVWKRSGEDRSRVLTLAHTMKPIIDERLPKLIILVRLIISSSGPSLKCSHPGDTRVSALLGRAVVRSGRGEADVLGCERTRMTFSEADCG